MRIGIPPELELNNILSGQSFTNTRQRFQSYRKGLNVELKRYLFYVEDTGAQGVR